MATFPKAIPSILFASGALSKGSFVALEVVQAVKNYQNGNVVAVLDTLSVLTGGKFAPERNKSGTVRMVADVQAIAKASKTAFRKMGFALALLDVLAEDATEELGASYCELAKVHADELKTAYESTPARLQLAAAKAAVKAENESQAIAPETVDPVETAKTVDMPLFDVVQATIDAIRAGAVSDLMLIELRIALSETQATVIEAIPAVH